MDLSEILHSGRMIHNMNFCHRNLPPKVLPWAGAGAYLGAFKNVGKIVFWLKKSLGMSDQAQIFTVDRYNEY
jgi:hypothetical protein